MAGTLGTANPFRYRSYYYDNETGYYYLQSRYYDPNMGRFINADDVSKIDGTSMFEYCKCNPVMFTDKTGYEFDWNLFWQHVLPPIIALILVTFCLPAVLVSPYLRNWVSGALEDYLKQLGVSFKLTTYKWYDYRIATISIDLDNNAVQKFEDDTEFSGDILSFVVILVGTATAATGGTGGAVVAAIAADFQLYRHIIKWKNKGRGVRINLTILSGFPYTIHAILTR